MEAKDRFFIHPKAYWRVINFIENMCYYREGELAGQKIKVHTWFKWQIRTIYGRYDSTTHKRAIREAYIEVPKKNAKSMYISALGLYHLCWDGYYNEDGSFTEESAPQCFAAASTREQARIIHDLSKWMAEKNPLLLQELRPMQFDIKHRSNGGMFKVLSSDAGGSEGVNSSANFIDELHVHSDGGALYRALKGSGAARPQPLTIIITTAGIYDPMSIGWQRHEYAQKLMNDWTIDPHQHGMIFTAGDIDEEEVYLEETWKRANPSYGTSVKKDYFEARAKETKNDPTMLNTFKRYHLNIWTSSHSQWIPKELYRQNQKGGNPEANKGERCWIGMDLGATDDLTAIARLFHNSKEDTFRVEMDFFCTANKIDAIHNNSQYITYMKWVKNGFIDIAGERDTDYSFIEDRIHEHVKAYKVRAITYDPYAAFEIIQNLGKKYINKQKGFLNPLTMTAKHVSPPMKKLQQLVSKGEIEMYNNPVLEWMFDNVMVKIDANQNIFPNKKEAKGKIDGIVAITAALDGYLNDKFKDGQGPKVLII